MSVLHPTGWVHHHHDAQQTCPHCGHALVHVPLNPRSIPTHEDGLRTPGPYLYCPTEGFVVTLANGVPELV